MAADQLKNSLTDVLAVEKLFHFSDSLVQVESSSGLSLDVLLQVLVKK